MNLVTVTEANFKDLVGADSTVVLDFWAPWCGPCTGFASIFEAAAAKHPALCFGKVDTDEEQSLAEAFGIRSVPTLMIIRERILVARHSGAMSAAELEAMIEQARLIDMDDLRAELAAAEGDSDAIDH